MNQMNNQEQKLGQQLSNQDVKKRQICSSSKLLQLEVFMENTPKFHMAVKKPIKNFNKIRVKTQQIASLKHSDNNIKSNFADNFRFLQKIKPVKISHSKNIFQAYKQTLEEKHKKRNKQLEKKLIKIQKFQELKDKIINQSNSRQKIIDKQSQRYIQSYTQEIYMISNDSKSQLLNQGKLKQIKPRISTSQIVLYDLDKKLSQDAIYSISTKKSTTTNNSRNQNYPKHRINYYQKRRKCFTQQSQIQNQQSLKRSKQSQDKIIQLFNTTKNINLHFRKSNNNSILSHLHNSNNKDNPTTAIITNKSLIKQNQKSQVDILSYRIKSLKKYLQVQVDDSNQYVGYNEKNHYINQINQMNQMKSNNQSQQKQIEIVQKKSIRKLKPHMPKKQKFRNSRKKIQSIQGWNVTDKNSQMTFYPLI